MLSRSTILRSLSMLTIAIAAGHFMQNDSAIASIFSDDEEVIPTRSLSSGVPLPPTVMSEPATLPRAPSTLPGRVAVLAMQQGPDIQDDVSQTPFQFACDPEVLLTPLPYAELSVTLLAPCNVNERVMISHGELSFAAMTNDEGQLSVTIPALSEDATVALRLNDGAMHIAHMQVKDAGAYVRAILQWDGDTGLGLNAMEFGASFGDPGHVSAATPRDSALAHDLKGGYLMSLGDLDHGRSARAQVYSIPASLYRKGVELTVEAEVTAANCGQTVSAKAFRQDGDRPGQVVDLTLSVPDCDVIGDFVELNDVYTGRRLAAN